MKTKSQALIILLFCSTLALTVLLQYKFDFLSIASNNKHNEIPWEINECFKRLDQESDKAETEELKNNELAPYHFGLGLYIRNNWIRRNGLGFNLSDFFVKQGIKHPDNMSGIIISCYRKYLNNETIDFEEIISKHKSI